MGGSSFWSCPWYNQTLLVLKGNEKWTPSSFSPSTWRQRGNLGSFSKHILSTTGRSRLRFSPARRTQVEPSQESSSQAAPGDPKPQVSMADTWGSDVSNQKGGFLVYLPRLVFRSKWKPPIPKPEIPITRKLVSFWLFQMSGSSCRLHFGVALWACLSFEGDPNRALDPFSGPPARLQVPDTQPVKTRSLQSRHIIMRFSQPPFLGPRGGFFVVVPFR